MTPVNPSTLFDDGEYVEAFARVASLRREREEIVEAVRSGQLHVETLLSTRINEPAIAAMKVLPWLEAVPGLGKVASRRLLDAMDVPDDSVTNTLTGQQVEQIVQAAGEAAP